MRESEAALYWAKTRSGGLRREPAGKTVPEGMHRLVEPDGTAVWLVPAIPEILDTTALAEMDVTVATLDNPNETARVLACCVKLCWTNTLDPIWPGTVTSLSAVVDMYAQVKGGQLPDAARKLAVSALRQLDMANWVLFDSLVESVRIGPRASQWGAGDITQLRQLWTAMPTPASDKDTK